MFVHIEVSCNIDWLLPLHQMGLDIILLQFLCNAKKDFDPEMTSCRSELGHWSLLNATGSNFNYPSDMTCL